MKTKKSAWDKHIILTKRKLVDVNGTLYVSLPLAFIKRHSLQKGDTVPIVADSILKIIPMQEID